jgi:DNA mismatch endonuclease (patch repair protein)
MTVRRLVHGLGYRYRLHDARLPGSPDLVLVCRRKVIFVHGCFWHRHDCRAGMSEPATRQEYWRSKFARNVARDRRDRRALRAAGWRVLVVWECQTAASGRARLRRRLTRFLESA